MDRSLVLDQVEIRKDGKPLIALDARIAPGEVLTLMGPSGIGKSTLLAYVTGSLPSAFVATGRVLLHGRDILRREVPEPSGGPRSRPHLRTSTLPVLLIATLQPYPGGKGRGLP